MFELDILFVILFAWRKARLMINPWLLECLTKSLLIIMINALQNRAFSVKLALLID